MLAQIMLLTTAAPRGYDAGDEMAALAGAGPDHTRSSTEITMPNMSDSRRKKIQARQRKAENAKKREAKIEKKERNAKPVKAAAR
jgi:hypothetical protein